MHAIILSINHYTTAQDNGPMWALGGVFIGAVATGLINYFLQSHQFKHNKEMFLLQNLGREKAKEYLIELLNHVKYPERKFSTLKRRIGAFNDDELRHLLLEIDALKSEKKDGEEYWYLKERENERKNATPKKYN